MIGASARIYRSIDELYQCCETIEESENGCGDCPMSHSCIKDMTIYDFALDVPQGTIDEFITAADELTSYYTKEDALADEANLRRCDPEE